MRMPTTYNADILGYDGSDLPSGEVECAVYSLIYPPIGFFPFYGIGNGDYHGFYWPIDGESEASLVAFSSHDACSLIPEHASVESLYQCQLARTDGEGSNDDDGSSIIEYRKLAANALGRQPVEHGVRALAANDFEELLLLDPSSPFYLCAVADVEFSNNRFESAEANYRKAIEHLPEYVAAHYGLACVLRRQRRMDEATIHLRLALIGPQAFYGGSFWYDTSLPGTFRNDWRRKSLVWLQGSKPCHELLIGDPFVVATEKLTLKNGLAESPDIDVLKSVVDQYASNGAFADAASIWQLIGDFAACETTSFRQRYSLNPRTYGTRLGELFELSGNSLRAALVRNMLSMIRNPEGLYL